MLCPASQHFFVGQPDMIIVCVCCHTFFLHFILRWQIYNNNLLSKGILRFVCEDIAAGRRQRFPLRRGSLSLAEALPLQGNLYPGLSSVGTPLPSACRLGIRLTTPLCILYSRAKANQEIYNKETLKRRAPQAMSWEARIGYNLWLRRTIQEHLFHTRRFQGYTIRMHAIHLHYTISPHTLRQHAICHSGLIFRCRRCFLPENASVQGL